MVYKKKKKIEKKNLQQVTRVVTAATASGSGFDQLFFSSPATHDTNIQIYTQAHESPVPLVLNKRELKKNDSICPGTVTGSRQLTHSHSH